MTPNSSQSGQGKEIQGLVGKKEKRVTIDGAGPVPVPVPSAEVLSSSLMT